MWGADYVGDTKTLDVHIERFTKVETDPAKPAHRHRPRAWLQVRVGRLEGPAARYAARRGRRGVRREVVRLRLHRDVQRHRARVREVKGKRDGLAAGQRLNQVAGARAAVPGRSG